MSDNEHPAGSNDKTGEERFPLKKETMERRRVALICLTYHNNRPVIAF